jgi:secreted Zn-dependent insulinase-like peptidase
MFNFLSVEIQLTWAGFSNWIAVVGHVCTYIQMLKETNLPEWLFEELKQIAQNSFGNS